VVNFPCVIFTLVSGAGLGPDFLSSPHFSVFALSFLVDPKEICQNTLPVFCLCTLYPVLSFPPLCLLLSLFTFMSSRRVGFDSFLLLPPSATTTPSSP